VQISKTKFESLLLSDVRFKELFQNG